MVFLIGINTPETGPEPLSEVEIADLHTSLSTGYVTNAGRLSRYGCFFIADQSITGHREINEFDIRENGTLAVKGVGMMLWSADLLSAPLLDEKKIVVKDIPIANIRIVSELSRVHIVGESGYLVKPQDRKIINGGKTLDGILAEAERGTKPPFSDNSPFVKIHETGYFEKMVLLLRFTFPDNDRVVIDMENRRLLLRSIEHPLSLHYLP